MELIVDKTSGLLFLTTNRIHFESKHKQIEFHLKTNIFAIQQILQLKFQTKQFQFPFQISL